MLECGKKVAIVVAGVFLLLLLKTRGTNLKLVILRVNGLRKAVLKSDTSTYLFSYATEEGLPTAKSAILAAHDEGFCNA